MACCEIKLGSGSTLAINIVIYTSSQLSSTEKKNIDIFGITWHFWSNFEHTHQVRIRFSVGVRWIILNSDCRTCISLVYLKPLQEMLSRMLLSLDSQTVWQHAQVWKICPLKSQNNYWNRLKCLDQKHLILLGSLKELFSGNHMKISDCI